MPSFRLSPSVGITAGMVSLTLLLFWMIEIAIGFSPASPRATQEIRENITNNLSIYVANLLEKDDIQGLKNTLLEVKKLNSDITLIKVLSTSGELIAQSSDLNLPPSDASPKSSATLSVTLYRGQEHTATVKVSFASPLNSNTLSFPLPPSLLIPLLIIILGSLIFYLYLRRVLLHLDPTNVIPERVTTAFDTLNEGVLVIDLKGQVLLFNEAFKHLHPHAKEISMGQKINTIKWLKMKTESAPPWETVLEKNLHVSRKRFDITLSQHDKGDILRHVIINASPIINGEAGLNGCLVTFLDITEQEKTTALLKQTNAELQTTQNTLEGKNKELYLLASYDQLTGLLNRRAFFSKGNAMFERYKKTLTPLVCIMCDIDHFKRINDTHGHGVGDEAIRIVSRFLRDTVRPNDLVGRYGGEEFVIMLPDVDELGACRVAERIRTKIETLAGKGVRSVEGLHFTCSFGLASLDHKCETLSVLIDKADQALYVSKDTGRNKVSVYK